MALEPGSLEWIEAHQKGLTASDAAVAVGLGNISRCLISRKIRSTSFPLGSESWNC